MTKRRYQLVKGWVYAGSANLLYMRFSLEGHGNTSGYLLLGLGDELEQKVIMESGYVCTARLTDVNNTCRAYSPTVFSSSL